MIGLDCAMADVKVGLALGVLREGRLKIEQATL